MERIKGYFQLCRACFLQPVLDLYLAVLGFGLSLYLYDGYYGISYDKFLFWRKYSILFLILSIAALLIQVLMKHRSLSLEKIRAVLKPDGTDLCMGVYAVFLTLSYINAIDQKEAVWGTFGWQMGWLTFLIMIAWYFIYRKFYRWHPGSFVLICAGGVLVNGIGILQRMGLVEISHGAGEGMYLSTIGNINWLAGYLSVIVPAGMGFFLGMKKEKRWITVLFSVLHLIAFVSLLTNGSNSVYLLLLGVLPILFLLGISCRQSFQRMCLILVMFGFACELVHLYILTGPPVSFYAGNEDNYGRFLIQGHIGLWIALVFAGADLTLGRWMENGKLTLKHYETVFGAVILAGAAGLVIFTALQVFDLLPLPTSWGNNRAALWKVASLMVRKLPSARKLYGVGEDCFAQYLINEKECRELLIKIYTAEKVTNAHSEYLTMLVNTGLFGLISFLMTVVSAAMKARLSIRSETEIESMCARVKILMLAGVLVHFLVSFPHIMLLPYVFVLLAASGPDEKAKTKKKQP